MIAARLARAELRQQPGRYAAVVLAVVVSVAFAVASVGVVRTELGAAGAAVSRGLAQADVVVQHPGDETTTAELVARVQDVAGVAVAEPLQQTWVRLGGEERSTQASLGVVPDEPRLRPGELAEGRWPSTPDEIVLDSATATELGLSPGDPMEITRADTEGERPATVVGLVAAPGGFLSSSIAAGWVAPDWFDADDVTTAVLVLTEDEPGSLLAPLTAAVDPDGAAAAEGLVPVETADELAEQQVRGLLQQADVLTALLLVFVSIAALVGALIIANTFTVLLAQRRRQVALLRTLGGTTAQLRRGLLLEAAAVGAIGAGVGVVLGLALTAAVAGWSGSLANGLVVSPVAVVTASLAAVVVTAGAAVLGTRRATRVAPMEALRPVVTGAVEQRALRRRLLVCVGLAVTGTGLAAVALSGAARASSLPLAVGAGATLSLAVLAAAPLYVSPLVGLLGALLRVGTSVGGGSRVGGGPVGVLAVANLRRNPQRAAATCVALMLAVGVTVTMQTGAATTAGTLVAGIQDRFPVAVSLNDQDGEDLDPALVESLSRVDGVTAAMPVAAYGGVAGEVSGRQLYGTLYGLDPARAQEFLPAPLDLDDDSVAVAPIEGVRAGDPVTVTVTRYDEDGEVLAATSRELRAVPSDAAHEQLLVSEQTFAELTAVAGTPSAGEGGRAGLWLATDPDADPVRLAADLDTVLQTSDAPLTDHGFLVESAGYTQLLDALVRVATALLAAAVLISLLGVGNTLALSVTERTRESGLLRALGLERGQLRAVLLVEALLLALVGSGVGVLAGLGLGWLGAGALMVVLEVEPVRLAVPWLWLVVVLGVALVAAAAASVLPGRRAARVPPVVALATG